MPSLETKPWVGTCLQTDPVSLKDAKTIAEVRTCIKNGIARFRTEIAAALETKKSDLFLLPEKSLGDRESDLRGCIELPGPEVEDLQKVAQEFGIYIGANAYTKTSEFPGRYFNTSFLLAPDGNFLIKAYRLHTYHSASPHDFWPEFLDKVGLDGAFPIARTALGNFAILPSMELMFPEVARILVLRGAEILLHTTMDKIIDRSVKRTRATENLAYLMSANVTFNVGSDRFMDSSSLIVNWRGQELAECKQGTHGHCSADFDVGPLRRRRADPDFTYPEYGVNYLSRLRTEIAATGYAAYRAYPAGTYHDGTTVTAAMSPDTANRENLLAALENLEAGGIDLDRTSPNKGA